MRIKDCDNRIPQPKKVFAFYDIYALERFDVCAALRLLLWACIFLMLFAIPNSLQAEEVELKTSVDRDEVRIADPFQFEIQLLAPEGTQVSFPSLPDTLGPFDVLDVKGRSEVPVADARQSERLWSRSLTLETITTGALQIPSIEVVVSEAGKSERILRTEPISVAVGSVLEPSTDLTQFQGIADLHDVEVPTGGSHTWIWVASGIAALAFVAGGMLLFAKRRRKIASSSDWALQGLNETRDLSTAESIVRQFIEERFEFAASSLASDEILKELRQNNVDEQVLKDLQEFLAQSERAKFGGLSLPATEEARLVNHASKLVKRLDEVVEANR